MISGCGEYKYISPKLPELQTYVVDYNLSNVEYEIVEENQ
jgi:hypothetical protein